MNVSHEKKTNALCEISHERPHIHCYHYIVWELYIRNKITILGIHTEHTTLWLKLCKVNRNRKSLILSKMACVLSLKPAQDIVFISPSALVNTRQVLICCIYIHIMALSMWVGEVLYDAGWGIRFLTWSIFTSTTRWCHWCCLIYIKSLKWSMKCHVTRVEKMMAVVWASIFSVHYKVGVIDVVPVTLSHWNVPWSVIWRGLALAQPVHPIRCTSRNKRRDMWVGWFVSSWRPWF